MSNLFPAQTTPDVSIVDGKPQTTSLAIAEYFDKQHFHVLRSIQNLDYSKEFTEANFGLSNYIDKTGRKLPMYNLTKDGFTSLVMGFTGREAARFKEAYIKRFNEMEATLKKDVKSQVDSHAYIEVLEKYVALLEEKNVPKPKRHAGKRVTDEAKIKFSTLREAGFTNVEIAEQTGYSDSTVSLVLKGMMQ